MRIIFAAALALAGISPAHAETFTIDQAIDRFTVDMKDNCGFEAEDIAKRKENAQMYTVISGEMKVPFQIFELWCDQGAYNVNTVYYLASPYNSLALVQFVEPILGVKDVLQGFSTVNTLTNAGVDPKTNSISFFAKGRGIGDCFNAGTYRFVDGRFVLKRYEVDSTCDGKINPKKIVNFK